MSHILYPNFRNNSIEYTKSLETWDMLWKDLLPFCSGEWHSPWLTSQLCDGNPIFSALCQSNKRGIRIIQEDPEEGQLPFTYWLDTFGGEQTDPMSIKELVISCVLTENVLMQAKIIILNWIQEGQIIINSDALPQNFWSARAA